MKVLLLLALAAVGQCALLGSKKCTYGPSYWCSHIHHAKECGAMQHCMDTVWKKQQTGMTGSTESCFDIIQLIDAVRKHGELSLMDRMAVGCTALPVEKRPSCKEFVANDEKELTHLLSSDLPSTQIAAALGLCGGFPDTVAHPEVAGDYCTDCVNFFSDLREIFNNSEAKVEDLLKTMVCQKVGPLEDLCDQLVDQYANMIYGIIYQQLNPQDICFLLQLCQNQTHAEFMKTAKYILAKRVRSNETCDVCMSVAKDVQDALRDPTLQTDITNALLDDVCPLLPGDLATQCKSYVQAYAPFVFQLLVSELDPKTICQYLGMCGNTTASANKLAAVPLSSYSSSVRVMGAEEPKVKLGPTCALCEYVMSELAGMVTSNSTEAEIEAALEKVCTLLPSTLSQECDAFIKEYADLVIQLLIKEVTPKEICTLLGLCTASKAKEPVKPMLVKAAGIVPSGVKGATECMICEQVITYVKAEIEKAGTEKSIEQILNEVCNIFPSSSDLRTQCETFVNTYTPTIIMLIEQFADPKQICQAIGLCTAEKKSDTLKFQPMMELSPAKPLPHLLGSSKCTWGPSYWCKNEDTAKECNAVEHCVKYRGLKISP